jgi:hypothetical protein
MHKLKLPVGIIKALLYMRKGESSRIIVQPKYGFRKILNLDEYFDNIKDEHKEKIKTSTLVYEIKLINFVQIYDISGNKTMMKYILRRGEGIEKPSTGDKINFNFKFKIGSGNYLIIKENQILQLTEENFSQEEMKIFKSLKKGECSSIEVSFTLLNNLKYLNSHCIIPQEKNRLFIEIDLIKFEKDFYILTETGVDYKIKTLNKGLGYLCPWRNSLIKLALTIRINNKLWFSHHNNFDISCDKYLEYFKIVKKKIKSIKNFQKNLQFIIDDFINDEFQTEIFDPLMQGLPKIFFSEIIPKMKLLETVSVSFKDKIDYLKINDQHDILNDNIVKEYDFIITLINFQEMISPFNNVYNEEIKLKNVLDYKSKANFFFSNYLLNKAEFINQYLVDEYLKQVNLERGLNKLSKNQVEFNPIILQKNLNSSDKISLEMRKVISNLILVEIKLKKFLQSLDYIHKFYILFDTEQKDEKILYYHIQTLKSTNQYDLCKNFLEKIIFLHENSSMKNLYEQELEIVKLELKENEKKKKIMIQKMFKFDNY